MRRLLESGFIIDVPKATSFRLSESLVYTSLKGLSLREMDIGWWDNTRNKLIIVELKGNEIWSEFDKDKDKAHLYLVNIINEKATDTLFMLAAAWIGTELGEKLKNDLPTQTHRYPGENGIKLVFLIDTPAERKTLLVAVKDEVNRNLAGKLSLFGVRRLNFMDSDTAMKNGIPISRQP